MICLSSGKVTTNEGYKLVVRRKIKVNQVSMLLGILTAVVLLCNEIFNFVTVADWVNNLYAGIGTGLFASSIVCIIKYKKLLRDEAALKEERLKIQDERNILISQKAAKSAAMVVLICAYVAMLIGGLFSKVIFFCFWIVAMVFLAAYIIFSIYYSKKKL